MHKYLLMIFLIPTLSFAQNTFKKDTNATKEKYYVEDIVLVTDGKGDNIKVKFTAIIPVETWDSERQKSGTTDKDFLHTIADNLSASAKEALKNPLSFSPFSKEIILWSIDRFTCDYQLTGRNGYGNNGETSIQVSYVPNTNPLEQPLPKRH